MKLLVSTLLRLWAWFALPRDAPLVMVTTVRQTCGGCTLACDELLWEGVEILQLAVRVSALEVLWHGSLYCSGHGDAWAGGAWASIGGSRPAEHVRAALSAASGVMCRTEPLL